MKKQTRIRSITKFKKINTLKYKLSKQSRLSPDVEM